MNTEADKDKDGAPKPSTASTALKLLLAWTFVGVPLFWGVKETLVKVLALFR